MVDYITSFNGRTFVERPNYITSERYPAGIAKNKVFCITVDKATEIPIDRGDTPRRKKAQKRKKVIRIIRWRAINDREHQNAKLWVQLRSYNIRSLEEWQNSASFVNSLMRGDFRDTGFVRVPMEDYDKLMQNERKIDQLESEIKKIRNEERALEIESAAFRKRVEIMKINKRRYEDLLLSFQQLVENPNTTETEIHKFIKKNKLFWFFGLEYIDLESKVKFPPQTEEYEFDLMLKRYDNYFDLVELKGPNERLFSSVTSHRKKPRSKLSEALSQVMTYMHACEKDTTLKNLLKPKAIVIIGKEQSDDSRERRIMSSFLSNVEIITYSELVQRGRKLFEYIDTL
jgi:hypothetical protein